MILVDVNLLLYAEDKSSEFHAAASTWWDGQLSGTEPVCLCWPVINAFIRIGTSLRVSRHPLTLAEAAARVQSWLDQPCVRLIPPTENHWKIFQQMLRVGNARANLVSDAHLAALAVEHNCILQSSDTDFARFRGLKWRNPIAAD
jgi:toxin-antitoxin system PIN domain toxin